MNIGIANDHRGYALKCKVLNYLNEKGYNVTNYGTDSSEFADYPVYAFKLGEAIRDKEIDLGILICGTGIGMSIAANKVKGVRCALVHNTKGAKLARNHNDANCIALSSSLNMFRVKDILDVFVNSKFSSAERHRRRVDMINNYKWK